MIQDAAWINPWLKGDEGPRVKIIIIIINRGDGSLNFMLADKINSILIIFQHEVYHCRPGY